MKTIFSLLALAAPGLVKAKCGLNGMVVACDTARAVVVPPRKLEQDKLVLTERSLAGAVTVINFDDLAVPDFFTAVGPQGNLGTQYQVHRQMSQHDTEQVGKALSC